MGDGSLTAKPLTIAPQYRAFRPVWGWENASSWLCSIGYKTLKTKSLFISKRNTIMYLTSIHSYFIIRLQSLWRCMQNENTHAMGTVPRGYYPARPSESVVQ